MHDQRRVSLGPNLIELAKSALPAGLADESGAYPFFCSSSEPKAIGQWLMDGEAVVLGTGGVASVNFGRGKFAYSTDCWAIQARKGELSTEYLYRVLQHCLPKIDYAGFEGSGLRHLRKDFIRKLAVDAPNDQVQAKTVQILASLDDAIEQTEALNAKNQQVKVGLMHDLFTRGVTPDGQLRPPFEQAPQLYKKSPLGWIPREWDVVRLDSIADVNRGKFSIRPRNDPRYYGGAYPFIQTGDVAAAEGRVSTNFTQTLNARGLAVSRLFPVGAVMVTIAANIADTCILGIAMCAPDSLVGVVPHSEEDAPFIEISVRRRKRFLESRAPQTAQKNINLEDLRPLLIAWPEKGERLKLAQRYCAADSALGHREQELEKLRDTRAGLMHDLLTGHVRVQVPATEIDTAAA